MAVYTTITKIDAELPSHSPDDAVVLRPEQLDAVDRVFKYFKKKKSNQKYLWNAKMRFGKTLCALELARKMGTELDGEEQVHRTLIVTHRPVVKQSWKEDFDKIFGKDCESYHYGTKFDDDGSDDFYELERSVKEEGKSYVFFASMQYLRRSTLVGGDNDEQLKKDILQNSWDLVVIDEAHEGTQTNLGQRVIDFLIKDKPTKALHLSGTPFNLYEDFTDEQIYTWDYIKEQTSKREWSQNHPLLPPEENPYLELPEMEIRTFDLGKLLKADLGEDATFQFKEFFRTYQGQNVPEDKKGKFVHEDAVKEFLDRMCQEDETSHYPFSTEEYRTFFNHTLWVVPGVKEAKALEDLLNDHEIFGGFDAIINVAGKNEDDETRQDALQKVKDKIGVRPDLTYTITISCGRLTTGVTVRPWTAVFYLKGSENTSAATYMQTIFRVQSPYHYKDSNGDVQMKTKCYVFDFAPDRTLKMVAETAKFATLTQKQKQYARAATSREKDIENMENFLSFCPVIAMEGGAMVEFKADKLFEQLEHVYVDRVVRNGFNDNSVYDIRELMNLNPEEIKELDGIGEEISKTTNMEKPKRATNIEVSKNKLTPNQQAAAERAHKKEKAGKELTEEEKAALEAEKKRKEEERKERDNRITILRGIALRIPLLMYGANVTDEEEGITLQNFTRLIDDSSWAEFMPRGVDKKAFNKFKKCFNATVFVAAGKRYRQLAREADSMHINERIQRIAEIFSYFHNPDKETVLTPWRVVNMHMSDCLGGYTFYNERFDGPAEKEVIGRNGTLFEWIPTTEPRYVDRGDVTHDVFGNSNAKILEINSKTGLYPLYVAYSLYRQRCKDFVKAGLIEDENNYSVEEEQVIWDDILANNIYVICNTPMAELITHRTLLGFRTLYQRNGTEQVNIKSEKLIERAMNDSKDLISDICTVGYWRKTRNKEQMVFSAVVGNPPYMKKQESTSDDPIYHTFMEIGFKLSKKCTFITPARYLFNAGKTPREFNSKVLNDSHFKVIWYKSNSADVFPNVDIKGGVAVFLRDEDKDFGKIVTYTSFPELKGILQKVVLRKDFKSIDSQIYLQNKFNLTKLYEDYPQYKNIIGSGGREKRLTTSIFEQLDIFKVDKTLSDEVGVIGLINNNRTYRYIPEKYLDAHDNLTKYKVILPKSNGSGALGEVLSTPLIGEPLIGYTQSFISIGSFESEEEASAAYKYIRSKFMRVMLGILKVTQDNNTDVWKYVPLQDFTSNSDIDWSKSVAEIDQQLYKKYGLSQDEQDFIESMIKPME
jgi:hypothetical protein